MNLQLKGVNVANLNAEEGVSIVRTADGALTEITDIFPLNMSWRNRS